MTDFERYELSLSFFCELTPATILDNFSLHESERYYPRQWNAGAVAEKNFDKVYHPKPCWLDKTIANFLFIY